MHVRVGQKDGRMGGKTMALYIVTDAACDLPKSFVDKQKDFCVIPMPYHLDGQEKMYVPYDGSDALHRFYDELRNGAVATTAQVSLTDYQRVFTDLVKDGHEVVYICFTSGLSGTLQTAELAKGMVLESYPNARIYILDSLCPSGGEGLLVYYALQKRDEGMDADALVKWVLAHRQNIAHWFTVDDLDFLYRGGRVSRSSAFLGGMLKIKPILNVNFEGKLIPQEKVAGRKRALKVLAEKYAELAVPKTGQTVVIGHGDCLEDAQYTADVIRHLVPDVGEILFWPIGAIIGAHSGPGTVAVFFLCASR